MSDAVHETSIEEKIKKVNEILLKGEPYNISEDAFSGFTGYKPQYIVDSMNLVFGVGGWGFDEISSEVFYDEKKGERIPTIVISCVRAFIQKREYSFTGWGQARITRGDIGDAKKGAQTDALKKALSYFSIGNRAYHGKLSSKEERRRMISPQAKEGGVV